MDNMLTKEDWQELRDSTVYFYSGKETKSHTQVFIVSAVFIITIAVVFGILMATDVPSLSAASLAFIAAFLLMVAYIFKHLQIDAMKALTQYFIDSKGDCYKVIFTKVTTKAVRVQRHYSAIPLVGEVKTFIDSIEKLATKDEYMAQAYADAQDKILGYYYVSRFKQGIKDWNWLYGGEAKVVYLGKKGDVSIPGDYV